MAFTDCVFCKKDAQQIAIIPYWDDGGLQAFACLPCAKKHNLFCKIHDCPHTGFSDRTTACLRCVDAEVRSKPDTAHIVFERLKRSLPKERFEVLCDDGAESASITGDSLEISIFRFIVVRAHCLKVMPESLVDLIIINQDMMAVFPSY